MAFHDLPDRYKIRRLRELERRKVLGEPLDLSFEAIQELLDPTYRNYICADDRPFYNETVGIQRHVIDGLKLHGIYERLVAEGLPINDPWTSSETWRANEFALDGYTMPSQRWADSISSLLKASFLTRSSREWESLYEAWHLPGAAQQTTKEWLNEEHANLSGLVITVDDPVFGRMKQPGSAVHLQSSAKDYLHVRASPRADADRHAILTQASESRKREVSDRKPSVSRELPLKGLRILDVTNVLGGPTIASTLSRFGADVIHVGPSVPSFEPAESIVCGAQCGKGKRSLLLDLKSQKGREVLTRLIRRVDVVTYNGTDSQLERLGISHRILLASNPRVILCQLTAFDGPAPGPRSDRLGYDDLAQAVTGVMARFGGSLKTPEEHAHVGTIDVMGGFLGAFAALVALFKRERGGGPDHAKVALVSCGEMIQCPFMYDYPGRAPFSEPCGRDTKGESALYRLYRASDGWFFLGAKNDDLKAMSRIPELSGATGLQQQDLEKYLEGTFETQPLSYWISQLQGVDVGAYATQTMASLREKHLVEQAESQISFEGPSFLFLRNRAHPSGYTVDLFAPIAMRFKNAAVRIPTDQPKFGAHTVEILAELGYQEAEINNLIDEGVVSTSWHAMYLPN